MARRKTPMSMDQRAALPIAEENPGIEYLRLNRQEICEREINSAIRLFLIDEDPISAHVLASAATAIMEILGRGRAGVGLNSVREMLKAAEVPPDLENEAFAGLQHPYNFLKHSSSDLAVGNDFSVDYIVMTIYGAAHSYKLLFETTTTEMRVFNAIVQAWRPQWWSDDPNLDSKIAVARQMGLWGATRHEFCEIGRRYLQREWDQEGL
ncbi:hypothetical protein [Rhizobium sp. ZX09]|uniref:hypothetical protein n=1 Tax=Rhizobium sp. ZX09 TaxID=2291939 RepID=UPI001A99B3F9|nr:hypothetical protein [Rhizobium sp. ZX09]QSZ60586.1 hypothetical protein BTN45_25440 [Rhizobium sp. ZX09]